jgi:hypothetical protein
MVIRIPRTSLQPETGASSLAPRSTIATGSPINNAAAEMARPAGQAAELAARIYQQQRDEEILARVLELDTERRRADAEVVSSYQQQFGRHAVDQRGAALARITDNSKRLQASIGDAAVRRAWQAQDAALTESALNQLDGHYQRQRVAWIVESHQERAEQLVTDFQRLAFGEGYGRAKGEIAFDAENVRSAYRDSIARLGDGMGWTEERITNELRKADGAAFGQLAEVLLREQRFEEAQALAERHADKFEPTAQARVAAAAREGIGRQAEASRRQAIADESTRLAMKLAVQMETVDLPLIVGTFEQASDPARRGEMTELPAIKPRQPRSETPLEFFDRARRELDQQFLNGRISAELRDATFDRLREDYRMRREKAAETDSNLLGQAQQWLLDHPLAGVTHMPPELQAHLRQRNLLPSVIAFAENGHRYATNPDVLDAMRRRSPDEWRSRSWADWAVELRGNLNDQHLKVAQAMHEEAVGQATRQGRRFISLDRRLEQFGMELGHLPKFRTATFAERQAFDQVILSQVDPVLQQRQKDLGRDLTDEEVQRELDTLLTDKLQVAGSMYGYNEVRVLTASPEDIKRGSVLVDGERVVYSTIESSVRNTLAALLVKDGDAPSVENIIKEWIEAGRPKTLQDAKIAKRAGGAR